MSRDELQGTLGVGEEPQLYDDEPDDDLDENRMEAKVDGSMP